MTQVRVAAILQWAIALGFGAYAIASMRNLLAGKPTPWVISFHAFRGGPFDHYEGSAFLLLLAAFLVVCILQAIAGALLWGGLKSGAFLSLVLLPVGAFFWWGFALPIPPIFAILWTILIWLGRSGLS